MQPESVIRRLMPRGTEILAFLPCKRHGVPSIDVMLDKSLERSMDPADNEAVTFYLTAYNNDPRPEGEVRLIGEITADTDGLDPEVADYFREHGVTLRLYAATPEPATEEQVREANEHSPITDLRESLEQVFGGGVEVTIVHFDSFPGAN